MLWHTRGSQGITHWLQFPPSTAWDPGLSFRSWDSVLKTTDLCLEVRISRLLFGKAFTSHTSHYGVHISNVCCTQIIWNFSARWIVFPSFTVDTIVCVMDHNPILCCWCCYSNDSIKPLHFKVIHSHLSV